MIRTMPAPPSPNRSNGGALGVFAVFLRLGLTSFGGPIAHLGYFREEFVARRAWLGERRFAELLALCQFLPGPASSQLGFAIGLERAGYRGGVAAWLGFTLPSAVLMLAFASGAGLLAGDVGMGASAGLKAVAVAVVAHAVWGMARTLTPDLRRIGIALLAVAVALLLPGSPGQLTAVLVGVALGVALCRDGGGEGNEDPPAPERVSRRAAAGSLVALFGLLALLPILAAVTRLPLLAFADAFFRAGALVFGGGHVVLPLLQGEPAIAAGVAPEQFLAGYAAAQAVPGPMFSFAAYLGAVVQPGGGALTAATALVAVFLPGLLLLVGVLPFWNRLRRIPSVAAGVRGANAAVVGLLAAALYSPIGTAGLTGPAPVVIAVCALVLLLLRAPAWLAVLLGAAGGALAGALGLI